MKKISVIIPVYNTSAYLSKCLDSVVNQTLRDIEIICIDDCSTDDSLAILRDYASRDARIRIIAFDQNRGAARARNAGIESATGEYLGFIDSDDFIDLDFYEKLYASAVSNNADCAKGNYKDVSTGKVDENINEAIKKDKDTFTFGYCSAIFRKSVLEESGVKFPVLTDFEDPVFSFFFTLKANKIALVDDAFVNVVPRPNSLSRRIVDEKRLADQLAGLNMIIDRANCSDMSDFAYSHVMAFLFIAVVSTIPSNAKDNVRVMFAEGIMKLFKKLKRQEIIINKLSQRLLILANSFSENAVEQLLNYSFEKDAMHTIARRLRAKVKMR